MSKGARGDNNYQNQQDASAQIGHATSSMEQDCESLELTVVSFPVVGSVLI